MSNHTHNTRAVTREKHIRSHSSANDVVTQVRRDSTLDTDRHIQPHAHDHRPAPQLVRSLSGLPDGERSGGGVGSGSTTGRGDLLSGLTTGRTSARGMDSGPEFRRKDPLEYSSSNLPSESACLLRGLTAGRQPQCRLGSRRETERDDPLSGLPAGGEFARGRGSGLDIRDENPFSRFFSSEDSAWVGVRGAEDPRGPFADDADPPMLSQDGRGITGSYSDDLGHGHKRDNREWEDTSSEAHLSDGPRIRARLDNPFGSNWGVRPSLSGGGAREPCIPKSSRLATTSDIQETRCTWHQGEWMEFERSHLETASVGFLRSLNAQMGSMDTVAMSRYDRGHLAERAWQSLTQRGFRYLLRSSPSLARSWRPDITSTETWSAQSNTQVPRVLLCVVNGQFIVGEDSAVTVDHRSGAVTFRLCRGDARFLPDEGTVLVGDLVVIRRGEQAIFAGRTNGIQSMDMQMEMERIVAASTAAQLKVRRSGKNGTHLVGDKTEESPLWALSSNPIAARRQVIRQVLLRCCMSQHNGGEYSQTSLHDAVRLLVDLANTDLNNFVPLTLSMSEESAREATRALSISMSESVYKGERVNMLDNDPARFKKTMQQVFQLWSALFMFSKDVKDALYTIAGRVEVILRDLAHWTQVNGVYVVSEAFDQIDDLVLRLGHEVTTTAEFCQRLMKIPESRVGSSFSRHMRAIDTETHEVFMRGQASQVIVSVPVLIRAPDRFRSLGHNSLVEGGATEDRSGDDSDTVDSHSSQ